MAGTNSRKITKYPKNINNINIGVVFFAVVAIYIFISVISYLQRDHIVAYQVMEGSISNNNIYDAIALRDEKVIAAETDGYVNYLASEGERVGTNKPVYLIDPSGQLLEHLRSQGTKKVASGNDEDELSNDDMSELSNDDMAELRSQIVNFDTSFDEKSFYTVYDFKIGIDGIVQKLSNLSLINNWKAISDSSGGKQIRQVVAPESGIVVYSIDGYEGLTLQAMTADKFDKVQYQKEKNEKDEQLNKEHKFPGDPIYKMCTSEDWSIVIKVDDKEQAEEFKKKEADKDYVKVRFIKNQLESWGKVSTFTNEAGDTFVQLSFTNSMITFCRDRFLSVEIITDDKPGLKVPNSAIVEKTFFIVPKEYVTKDNENKFFVLREKYDEQGTPTTEKVAVTIYNETEDEYYLDNDVLRAGDKLNKLDSEEVCVVSKMDTLTGVYNINKGYAEFRQITVKEKNADYSKVQSNTMYGLNVYDYIVLDAAAVDNNNEKNAEKSAGAGNAEENEAPSEASGDAASVSSSTEETESTEESSTEASENE